MEKLIIDLDDIRKSYNDFLALEDISLKVKKGDVLGYIGPNGSGKTTTIKLILGLIKPDNGKVRIFGIDHYMDTIMTRENKARVGSILEVNGLFEDYTGLDNLVFWMRLYGFNKQYALDKSKKYLKKLKLEKWSNKKISTYSFGLKKRLVFARALVTEPELLVLDEPTLGVDPESRFLIRTIINQLAKEGKTIFISSHELREIQKICTRIVVIKNGSIIFNDKLFVLQKRFNYISLEESYLKLVGSI